MDKTSPRVTTCVDSLKLIADFWSLRIIEALASEKQRYCELQRTLDNVNPATLSKKLTELEAAHIVAKEEDLKSHTMFYTLTPLGKETLPILKSIQIFSKKFEGIKNQ